MSASVPTLCRKCSMPIGSVSVWFADRPYHIECCPHPLPHPTAPKPTSDDLIERLRARVGRWAQHDDMLSSDSRLFKEAADALAAKDTEISEMRAERDEARELAQMFSQASRKVEWIARATAAEARLERVKAALEEARKYIKRGYVNVEGGAILEQIDAALAPSIQDKTDTGVGG